MTKRSVESVAGRLREHVSGDAAHDLMFEDPAAALERHFGPLRAQRLGVHRWPNELCSTEGWYDATTDPRQPWVFYADAASPRRTRFTIVHEIGHHLLQGSASDLLDEIDLLGEANGGAAYVEELVCHNFAGIVLVPDEHLRDVIGSSLIVPDHIIEIHSHGPASYEAIAMRAAGVMRNRGAVVIMRDATKIGLCASSPLMEGPWWKRGSKVDPDGPLSRATSKTAHALEETFRWHLTYEQSMYCDAVPIRDDLAVAVLCDEASGSTRIPIRKEESRWSDRVDFCPFCITVERTGRWCDECKRQYCMECERCGCTPVVVNPVCPKCRLESPRKPGAEVCRDCE